MKFEKHFPVEQLKPYIKYYVVSENDEENEYKVFPITGLVIGFQFKGKLTSIVHKSENQLASAGISGMADGYKIFKNSAEIGTVLIYFTETGFIHFATHPANELFNLSLSLEEIFPKSIILSVEERLAGANNDLHRIKIVEQFLISQLKDIQTDKMIVEAVKMIYKSNGNIRIKELTEKLLISQSPFEKRFRKIVGTTAKKFASIVRFNGVLDQFNQTKTLSEICYDNNFFDQSHFIKDFKQFTGDTPDQFKKML